MNPVAVFTYHAELIAEANALAARLNLPFHDQADYLLLLTPDYLGLKKKEDNSLPIFVDFASPEMNYRRRHISLRKEALARALGLKKNTHPIIVDATAGLGRDSFIIAALGFSVMMVERSPINYALLANGIERAAKNPQTSSIVEKMQLFLSDAIQFLNSIPKPDIIYLDPMFPDRKKTALAKKEMRIFHEVIGDDPDSDALFKVALSCANGRVVVKRPRLAPELADLTPSYTLAGSSSRFDIYLT